MSDHGANPNVRLSPVGVTVLGMVVNVALAAAKVAAGVLCHSQTILADGMHSISDLATDVAVLAGIRLSRRPADDDHLYGHRRATTLVTAGVGLALLAAACYVGYMAIRSLRQPPENIRPALPLAAAIASIVLKEALYHLTVWVGRRSGDTSLVANAWHHRSDAWSSVAAAVGLAAMAIGGEKWHILDHLTAAVLASFLVVVAWRILRGALRELMDRAPSAELLERIRAAVDATEGVRSFHAFRARRVAGTIEMDIHVQVDPNLTVARGHDIAAEVEEQITQCCPNVVSVVVHVEPFTP
jgi:cation diffusion facilitator family transporter